MRERKGAPRFCTAPGCDKPYLAKGWCSMHWARMKHFGSLDGRPKVESCQADGCDLQVRSTHAEYCEMHYGRLRRTGSLEVDRPPRKRREVCTIDGCAELDYGPHGLCGKHWSRLQRNGDPLKLRGPNPLRGPENKRWTGDDATTQAVHQRVKKLRGFASSWCCTDCARPAAHWSYDHADPNERIDEEGRGPFSLDVDHYFPRCVRCHKRFDMDYLKRKRAA